MSGSELGALTALRRLRQVETDAARRDLGEAVTREIALSARRDALAGDLENARQQSGDFDREVFAAWFHRMLGERARLADAIREAEALAAAARETLARRRVAETAVEEALAAVIAARDAAIAHRDQLMLEEVARALKQASRPG